MIKELLNIKSLSFAYGKSPMVLNEVNLSLAKGEVVAIIGENGAGKSTLLKSICGLFNKYQGEIEFNNKLLSNWNRAELAKFIAYVSANQRISSIMSVVEFVGFGRYPYSTWNFATTRKDQLAVEIAIKSCKIDYLKSKNMSQLSDGERQKVYLAKAVAQDTSLIVLDEPTSHLDVRGTKAIFELIKDQKEKGKSVLFSSHQIEDALAVADKVWIVHCGRVISTTPDEFWKSEEFKNLIY